jgi:hypothetical protein
MIGAAKVMILRVENNSDSNDALRCAQHILQALVHVVRHKRGAQHSLDKNAEHERENKDDSNNRSNHSGCVVL